MDHIIKGKFGEFWTNFCTFTNYELEGKLISSMPLSSKISYRSSRALKHLQNVGHIATWFCLATVWNLNTFVANF